MELRRRVARIALGEGDNNSVSIESGHHRAPASESKPLGRLFVLPGIIWNTEYRLFCLLGVGVLRVYELIMVFALLYNTHEVLKTNAWYDDLVSPSFKGELMTAVSNAAAKRYDIAAILLAIALIQTIIVTYRKKLLLLVSTVFEVAVVATAVIYTVSEIPVVYTDLYDKFRQLASHMIADMEGYMAEPPNVTFMHQIQRLWACCGVDSNDSVLSRLAEDIPCSCCQKMEDYCASSTPALTSLCLEEDRWTVPCATRFQQRIENVLIPVLESPSQIYIAAALTLLFQVALMTI